MTTTKSVRRQVSKYLASSCVAACLLLYTGCGEMGSYDPGRVGLKQSEIPCTSTETLGRVRQYFNDQNIRGEEKIDGKKIFFTTIPVDEQERGRRKRQAVYVVEIEPTANTNNSEVILKWTLESRGIHERTWYNDASDPQFVPKHIEPLKQLVKSPCRPGQP